MPKTAKAKTGSLRRLRQDPRLGGVSACCSSMFKVDTQINAITIKAEKMGKGDLQPMSLKITRLATTPLTKKAEDALPMPLKPWAKLKFRLNAPLGLTSRMIGLPATCKKVVPMPRTKMHSNNSVNPGFMTLGIRVDIELRPKPSKRSFFMPILPAMRLAGILKTAKAIKTKNGSKVAIMFESSNCFWTASDRGPMESAMPMIKKDSSIGNVFNFMVY